MSKAVDPKEWEEVKPVQKLLSDREILLMAYGALKAVVDHTNIHSKNLRDVVITIEKHLWPLSVLQRDEDDDTTEE